MIYQILANIVVFLHLLWILFLVFGVLWGIRNKTARVIHISGLAFSIIIQIFDWYCPLTHLEVWLRSRHYSTLSYAGSFIIHYIEQVVYLEISRSLIFVLSILLCGINIWIYLTQMKR